MKLKRFLFIIITAVIFTVVILGHYMMANGYDAQNRSFSMLLTESIDEAIEAELNGPMQVALAMSQDYYVLNLLSNERYATDPETALARYLKALKEKVGYSSVYIISDHSRNEYGAEGIVDTIEPETDMNDVWYSQFLESSKPYVINVDTDMSNDSRWTIFIDVRLFDTSGRYLGVCGVGVEMKDLQRVLNKYEQVYGIKATIVNAEGLVQADVNSVNIETAYNHKAGSEKLSSGETVYTRKSDNGYVVTKYIEELDWYLVVSNDGHGFVKQAFEPGFLILCIVSYVLLLLVFLFFFKNSVAQAAGNKTDSQVDELTGFWNRNYFKEVFGEHGIFNTTRYKSVAVYDIDSFKETNDTLNGDDILRFITECTKKKIGSRGEFFRWGGDEFVILMEWSPDFAYGIFREICREIAEDGRVTISVGVTDIRMSDTVKKNYYRAAQGCYLVKEMGGNGVKLCDL